MVVAIFFANFLGTSGFDGTPFAKIQFGMVGNILWSGVSLKNILENLYPNECQEEKEAQKSQNWHVIFEGADEYETSTPLCHILNDKSGCLIATKMNGEILSADHGYPVRVILPGK